MSFNQVLRKQGLLGIAFISLILAACGGSSNETKKFSQSVIANKNGIVATYLEDNNGYVHSKGTQQFRLFGVNQEGETQDLTDAALWRVSNKALGTINSHGLFTPKVEAGELTLNVEFAGHAQSQAIIIANADLVSIAVSNAVNQVDVCRNTEFTATALFENGLILDYPLTWRVSSGNELAKFVSNTNPVLQTYRSGQIQVVAEGKNNAGEVIQSPPLNFQVANTLSSLALTAKDKRDNTSTRLREGQETTITATATYQDDTTAVITPNASLSLSNTEAATLNTSDGRLVAKAGSYGGTDVNIKAQCDTQEALLVMTITKPNLTAIEIHNSSGSTTSGSLTEGSSTEFSVTATFVGGTSDSKYNYGLEWRIDEAQSDSFDNNDLTIDNEGRLTASANLNLLSPLNVVVSVRALDSTNQVMVNDAGEELTDTIKITINPKQ